VSPSGWTGLARKTSLESSRSSSAVRTLYILIDAGRILVVSWNTRAYVSRHLAKSESPRPFLICQNKIKLYL
jgi:hypothetical protein